MAEILLFHHAHGLTEGLRFLARRLEAAGHVVHTPDLYSGRQFTRLDEGVAFAGTVGHDAIEEVARRAAREHPEADTVIGFSLGCFPAQLLAQEWRRVRRCALVSGALDPKGLTGAWRHDVALTLHIADPDDWVDEADVVELLAFSPSAHVHRYPGKRHLFTDPSTADYDADAADVFEERLIEWLAGTEGHTI